LQLSRFALSPLFPLPFSRYKATEAKRSLDWGLKTGRLRQASASPMIEAVSLAQGEPATGVCMSGAEMSMIILLGSWPVPRSPVMVVGERALSHRLTRWRRVDSGHDEPSPAPHPQPQPPCRLIARNGRSRHVVVSTVYPCREAVPHPRQNKIAIPSRRALISYCVVNGWRGLVDLCPLAWMRLLDNHPRPVHLSSPRPDCCLSNGAP
jgi:hypothetical protein